MSLLPVRATAVFAAQGLRPAQEDHVLLNREKGIFVVADGFGGPGPGAQAARIAAESVQAFLMKEAGDEDATMPFLLRSYLSLAGNVLFNGLIHANRKVMAMNRKKGIHERGGASLLAGFMDGDLLALASVGCCEAWLIRGDKEAGAKTRRLVTPRNYSGLRDPFGGTVGCDAPLGALGVCEDMEPEIFECQVRAGDVIFLNTDGLICAVTPQVSHDLVDTKREPGERVKAALAALELGEYRDNSSAAILIF